VFECEFFIPEIRYCKDRCLYLKYGIVRLGA
jgi:hypothetical protein